MQDFEPQPLCQVNPLYFDLKNIIITVGVYKNFAIAYIYILQNLPRTHFVVSIFDVSHFLLNACRFELFKEYTQFFETN